MPEWLGMTLMIVGLIIALGLGLTAAAFTLDELLGGDLLAAAFGLAGTLACFAAVVGILMVRPGGDDSEHCGPGAEYRESYSYNAATKVTEKQWFCEAVN